MGDLGRMILMVGVTLIGVSLGALVAIIARRACRVDDHPTCRRCGFDLIGLPAIATGACPECGKLLSMRRAVRLGNRRLHLPLFALGVLVSVAALFAGSAAITIQTAGTSIDRYKPAWLLIRESKSNAPATTDRALKELTRRLDIGELGEGLAREIVTFALKHQADTKSTWRAAWGDYLESAWTSGRVTPEERSQYLRNGLSFTLVARHRMAQGRPACFQLDVQASRLGTAPVIDVGWHLGTFEIGNRANTVPPFTTGNLSMDSTGWMTHSPILDSPLDAPLGDHQLTARWSVTLKSTDPSVPSRTFDLTLSVPVTVVDEHAPVLTTSTDPDIRDRLLKLISITSLRVRNDARNCVMEARYDPLPVALIGRTLLRERNPPAGTTAREWLLQDHYVHPSWRQAHWPDLPLPHPLNVTEVDVVFIPDPLAAPNDPTVNVIWGEELVIPSVKVTWLLDPAPD